MSYFVFASPPSMGVPMWGEQVTRRRRVAGAPDRYGNPTYTTVDVALSQGAAFDPGGSLEPVEVGRAAVVTTPKLYFLDSPDLAADDVVLVRDEAFMVVGDPAVWRDPWGSGVGGTVVDLKRAEG